MRGKVSKKLKAMAREMSKDNPALYEFYYKAAKKIHKKVVRAR